MLRSCVIAFLFAAPGLTARIDSRFDYSANHEGDYAALHCCGKKKLRSRAELANKVLGQWSPNRSLTAFTWVKGPCSKRDDVWGYVRKLVPAELKYSAEVEEACCEGADATTGKPISQEDSKCNELGEDCSVYGAVREGRWCKCDTGSECVSSFFNDRRVFDCAETNMSFTSQHAAEFSIKCATVSCEDFGATQDTSQPDLCKCPSSAPFVASYPALRGRYRTPDDTDRFKFQIAAATHARCFATSCEKFGGSPLAVDATICGCPRESLCNSSIPGACKFDYEHHRSAWSFDLRAASTMGTHCTGPLACQAFGAETAAPGTCRCPYGTRPSGFTPRGYTPRDDIGDFTIEQGVSERLVCEERCPLGLGTYIDLFYKENDHGAYCGCRRGQRCIGDGCRPDPEYDGKYVYAVGCTSCSCVP